jgi:predicted RNase H-like HicB family nuclease
MTRTAQTRRFDRSCTITIRWSEEDAVWLASCPELAPCTAHGQTVLSALRMLDAMIDLMEDE